MKRSRPALAPVARHRSRPHAQGGGAGQGRTRGPVRQGRHPPQPHPPRHRRRVLL